MPDRLPPIPALLLGLAFAVVGCERPFVETEPVVLAETAPDLSAVLTTEILPLRLRVSDAQSVERVTVNGTTTTRAPEAGLFLDTLRLDRGLNTLFVAIFDDEGNVTEDTLYAAYLPYATGVAPPLPAGRAEHTATALADGRILVAGGFDENGPTDATTLVQEVDGLVTYAPLTGGLGDPRGGHTATRLPDGRVLVLGGTTRRDADTTSSFVSSAEIYDPATGGFASVPIEGEPLRRYRHAAIALDDGGRVFVYVYGGLEARASDVAPSGSLVVTELRQADGRDVLTVVSPPGGIGGLPPAEGHALLALPPTDGLTRALATGAALDTPEPSPFALRLTFRPSETFPPFEVALASVSPPEDALRSFGATEVAPGLVLVAGGTTPPFDAASASSALRLYADDARRFFTFAEDVRLRVPRSGHTATLLPSGRILVAGGVSTSSGVLAQTELIGPN